MNNYDSSQPYTSQPTEHFVDVAPKLMVRAFWGLLALLIIVPASVAVPGPMLSLLLATIATIGLLVLEQLKRQNQTLQRIAAKLEQHTPQQ